MKDLYPERDFLNQASFIRIYGRYYYVGKLYRLLRKLFPEKCQMCNNNLHLKKVGNLFHCHGSIINEGKTFYVCRNCYEIDKIIKKQK